MQDSKKLIQSNIRSIKSVNGQIVDFREEDRSYDGKTLNVNSNINGVMSSSKIRNDTLMKILNQNNNKLNLETRLKKLTKKNKRKNKKNKRKNKTNKRKSNKRRKNKTNKRRR